MFELVGQRLNSMGKIFLFIEEFQHVVHNVSIRDQETVADTLKNLMETELISLIISGVETLTPFIALDPQLDRRLTKIYFRKLTPQDQDLLADMVHAVCRLDHHRIEGSIQPFSARAESHYRARAGDSP